MDWSAVQSCRPTPVLASHELTELSSPMQLRALTHECNKLGLPCATVTLGGAGTPRAPLGPKSRRAGWPSFGLQTDHIPPSLSPIAITRVSSLASFNILACSSRAGHVIHLGASTNIWNNLPSFPYPTPPHLALCRVWHVARQCHGPCMKPVGLWSTLARAQSPGESLYVITGRVPPGNPLDGRGSRGIMAPARAPYPPSIKLGVCCSGWVYFQIACCWWFFNIFLCIRVLYVPGLNYSFKGNDWYRLKYSSEKKM